MGFEVSGGRAIADLLKLGEDPPVPGAHVVQVDGTVKSRRSPAK